MSVCVSLCPGIAPPWPYNWPQCQGACGQRALALRGGCFLAGLTPHPPQIPGHWYRAGHRLRALHYHGQADGREPCSGVVRVTKEGGPLAGLAVGGNPGPSATAMAAGSRPSAPASSGQTGSDSRRSLLSVPPWGWGGPGWGLDRGDRGPNSAPSSTGRSLQSSPSCVCSTLRSGVEGSCDLATPAVEEQQCRWMGAGWGQGWPPSLKVGVGGSGWRAGQSGNPGSATHGCGPRVSH